MDNVHSILEYFLIEETYTAMILARISCTKDAIEIDDVNSVQKDPLIDEIMQKCMQKLCIILRHR